MKLLSLKGRNIGLLKGDFEFEFDDALTVITGPIGCGKSTILTMIRASLTNSFPGNAGSWASWGTPPQEACYFIASWRIGNKVLHIAKAVSGEKKFGTLNIPRLRIEHDDGKVEEVFASKEALEKTHALIPVPASIIDGHLIVDQDSITAPVSSTPAKFKEIIHTLTRTNELETLRGQVRDVMMSVTVPDVQGPLLEAKTELNLMQGEANRIESELTELARQYNSMQLQEVSARLDILDKIKKNDDKRTQLEANRTTAMSAYLQLQQQLKVQETAIGQLQVERAAKAAEAEEAKKALYSADMLLTANKRKEALLDSAVNLAAKLQECMASQPAQPADERPQLGADTWLLDRISELKQELMLMQKRLELIEKGQCPECGTSTAVCAHDLEQIKEAIAQKTAEVNLAVQTLAEVRRIEKEWQGYEKAVQEATQCAETTMAKAMEVDQELQTMQDLPKMTPEIKAALSRVASNFDMLERSVSSAENSISAVKGHIQSQIDMMSLIDTQLADIPPARFDANEYASLEKRNQDGLAIKQKAAKLEGSQESTLQGLDRAKAKVDAQEKRAASVKPIEDFRRILDKVNTILMKDGLPRLLSLQYMQKLNERLAFYLRTINADFSAFIDENLEFMARKSDGLVHHAKRLSGGQKQQASVCYLLAVNDVFASTLGVLALDEPSGAMQESNSRDLAEAFNYLAKMGQQTGRQFIVITHSNALAALGCKNISLEGHE
jgi:DNA repair exonuclease SbcCD ATPase subunit